MIILKKWKERPETTHAERLYLIYVALPRLWNEFPAMSYQDMTEIGRGMYEEFQVKENEKARILKAREMMQKILDRGIKEKAISTGSLRIEKGKLSNSR